MYKSKEEMKIRAKELLDKQLAYLKKIHQSKQYTDPTIDEKLSHLSPPNSRPEGSISCYTPIMSEEERMERVMDFSQALLHFNKGEFGKTASILLPMQGNNNFAFMGGSRAQRDIMEQLLITCAVYSKEEKWIQLSKQLIHQRLVIRENCLWTYLKLIEVSDRLGDEQQATEAHFTATRLGLGEAP